MLTQRKNLQTSSQSKRKCKYMLPLSKPKLIMDSATIRNISSDADRTLTSLMSKTNFSLKCLNTHRTFQRPSTRLRADETRVDMRMIRGNNCKSEKSKFDIVLCIQSKEIDMCVSANTVQELTYEIKRYLRHNRYNSKLKTIQSFEDNLALNYLLSVGDIHLQGLLHRKIKLRPYYGCNQSIINIQSFQIIRTIGSGGFSTVYLVRLKADGKFYAMKVLSKTFIAKNKKQRLVMNERNVMKTINHSYLAQLHWSFQSKNYLIFVMDYYPGGELFGVLKKYKRMSQSMARYYITEILLGLQGLHNEGIAYRDLKPQNILLDKDGHACISDFGLVKPGFKNSDDRTYSFCGSPQYMPPQIVARKGHSMIADFYSLGALLYELLTGLPPFYHRDPEQIYKGTLNGSLTVPSFLTESAKDLLFKLLCKSQQSRLGAKSGVQQILSHPWFGKIDKERFLMKKVIPPISFVNMEDLTFNEVEMKKRNAQYIKSMLKQQEQDDQFTYMLPDFKFSREEQNVEMKENVEDNIQIARINHDKFLKKKSIKPSASSQRFRRFDNFF